MVSDLILTLTKITKAPFISDSPMGFTFLHQMVIFRYIPYSENSSVLSNLTSDDYSFDSSLLDSQLCSSSFGMNPYFHSCSIDTFDDDVYYQDPTYSNHAYGCNNYYVSYDYDDVTSPSYNDYSQRRYESNWGYSGIHFSKRNSSYSCFPPYQGTSLFDVNSFGDSHPFSGSHRSKPLFRNMLGSSGEMIRHQSFPLDNRSLLPTSSSVSPKSETKPNDDSPQQTPSEEVREPGHESKTLKVESVGVMEVKALQPASSRSKQRRGCVKKVTASHSYEKPGNPDEIDPVLA